MILSITSPKPVICTSKDALFETAETDTIDNVLYWYWKRRQTTTVLLEPAKWQLKPTVECMFKNKIVKRTAYWQWIRHRPRNEPTLRDLVANELYMMMEEFLRDILSISLQSMQKGIWSVVYNVFELVLRVCSMKESSKKWHSCIGKLYHTEATAKRLWKSHMASITIISPIVTGHSLQTNKVSELKHRTSFAMKDWRTYKRRVSMFINPSRTIPTGAWSQRYKVVQKPFETSGQRAKKLRR